MIRRLLTLFGLIAGLVPAIAAAQSNVANTSLSISFQSDVGANPVVQAQINSPFLCVVDSPSCNWQISGCALILDHAGVGTYLYISIPAHAPISAWNVVTVLPYNFDTSGTITVTPCQTLQGVARLPVWSRKPYQDSAEAWHAPEPLNQTVYLWVWRVSDFQGNGLVADSVPDIVGGTAGFFHLTDNTIDNTTNVSLGQQIVGAYPDSVVTTTITGLSGNVVTTSQAGDLGYLGPPPGQCPPPPQGCGWNYLIVTNASNTNANAPYTNTDPIEPPVPTTIPFYQVSLNNIAQEAPKFLATWGCTSGNAKTPAIASDGVTLLICPSQPGGVGRPASPVGVVGGQSSQTIVPQIPYWLAPAPGQPADYGVSVEQGTNPQSFADIVFDFNAIACRQPRAGCVDVGQCGNTYSFQLASSLLCGGVANGNWLDPSGYVFAWQTGCLIGSATVSPNCYYKSNPVSQAVGYFDGPGCPGSGGGWPFNPYGQVFLVPGTNTAGWSPSLSRWGGITYQTPTACKGLGYSSAEAIIVNLAQSPVPLFINGSPVPSSGYVDATGTPEYQKMLVIDNFYGSNNSGSGAQCDNTDSSGGCLLLIERQYYVEYLGWVRFTQWVPKGVPISASLGCTGATAGGQPWTVDTVYPPTGGQNGTGGWQICNINPAPNNNIVSFNTPYAASASCSAGQGMPCSFATAGSGVFAPGSGFAVNLLNGVLPTGLVPPKP